MEEPLEPAMAMDNPLRALKAEANGLVPPGALTGDRAPPAAAGHLPGSFGAAAAAPPAATQAAAAPPPAAAAAAAHAPGGDEAYLAGIAGAAKPAAAPAAHGHAPHAAAQAHAHASTHSNIAPPPDAAPAGAAAGIAAQEPNYAAHPPAMPSRYLSLLHARLLGCMQDLQKAIYPPLLTLRTGPRRRPMATEAWLGLRPCSSTARRRLHLRPCSSSTTSGSTPTPSSPTRWGLFASGCISLSSWPLLFELRVTPKTSTHA